MLSSRKFLKFILCMRNLFIVAISHLFYMDSILETEFYPKVRKLQLSFLVIKLHKITQTKITLGKITQDEITQGNLLMNMNVKCHRVRVKVPKTLEKSYGFTKIYPSPIFFTRTPSAASATYCMSVKGPSNSLHRR